MNKHITTLYMALLIASGSAMAQPSYTTISYSMGFATGDLGSFISQPSFRGATIDYRKLVQTNIGLGISLGWNVFYEALDFDTYTLNNVSLSGKQWRYSNHLPMMAAADYYLSPGETFNPFFGLGVGTMYSRRNTDMNHYTIELNSWHFAMQPQVGFLYTINYRSALSVAAKYCHGFQSGQIDAPQGFFSLNLGFTFMD